MGHGGAKRPEQAVSPRAAAPGRRRATSDLQQGLPMAFPAAGPAEWVATEASTPCTAPFDGDDWLFNVDWEGSRCLLISAGNGSVRLQGETAPLEARFPEVAAAARFAAERPMVLDGSICVLDAQGRPDLAGLARRVVTGQPGPPAVYLVTDLLRLDGEAMTSRPLLARLAALGQLVPRDSRVQVPDHVVGHGRALASAAAERGLAALLARRQDAHYLAGVASPLRLRIALTLRRNAVVVGWRASTAGLRLLLADWVLGRLGIVGVAQVDDPASRRWLEATAEPVPGVAVDDPDAAGPGVTWVRPRLVASIEPGSQGRKRGLQSWRLVALRDDVDPMWCVRRPAVEPPQASSHEPLRPFSPTVLSPLPM
jgi:ATP-dependent DNA ligase